MNCTANPDRDGSTTMFFIIEEAKETTRYFSQRTVKVFCFNIISTYNDSI